MRAPSKTRAKAREVRRHVSFPEALLWKRIRHRADGGPAFRRQQPIGPYVLDFYCAKARRAVEINGMSHDVADRVRRDARRDVWLQQQGLTLVRLSAADVMDRVDGVADGIWRLALSFVARAQPPPPR
ncbi:endonuclease domain-containing protein [Roseiarcus sp.]|jgi:very-short-patch-repair endonuclease|uniref:endonuclease domain-containing protein n=1 Tax=Roseiarcus sp. TaxID=1969460 RepID=UPI003D101F1C